MNVLREKNGYIEIHVTGNKYSGVGKVDRADSKYLLGKTWYINSSGYLMTRINRKQQIFLHRLIMMESGNGDIDHKNMDKLDNRRENLRWVTRSQNMMNNNSKGVSFDKARNKWAPHIMINYKKIYLGRFDTFEEATSKRKEAVRQYFGEYGNA
jgi:hypothetical protein